MAIFPISGAKKTFPPQKNKKKYTPGEEKDSKVF